MPPAGCFREEVKNLKIWFSSHNFMTDVGGTIQEHDNICTKYGFDSLIISGSYGGHRRQTTPGVWHKLPTGELKSSMNQNQTCPCFIGS